MPAEDFDAQVAAKDAAYSERNRVVAALARLFPSGVARTNIPDWDITWEQCVYIDLPTGQVSWHFHDSEAHLFEGLPAYTKAWDGHTTEQKYERLAGLATLTPDERMVEAALDAYDRVMDGPEPAMKMPVGAALPSREERAIRAALTAAFAARRE